MTTDVITISRCTMRSDEPFLTISADEKAYSVRLSRTDKVDLIRLISGQRDNEVYLEVISEQRLRKIDD